MHSSPPSSRLQRLSLLHLERRLHSLLLAVRRLRRESGAPPSSLPESTAVSHAAVFDWCSRCWCDRTARLVVLEDGRVHALCTVCQSPLGELPQGE